MRRPIILDGGMGRELERMGAPFRQPEWSALALMETPELVRKAHTSFIKSGAEIITTNSYAVIPFHIGQEIFDAHGRDLIALSAKLAREAADEAQADVRVAGCIPPMFGSYQPELFDAGKAADMLQTFFDAQAPYVDLWIAETISSKAEAEAVCKAHAGRDEPLWLAYCPAEDAPMQLRSGEDLGALITYTAKETEAEAVLFNCCAIEDVEGAVRLARDIVPSRDDLLVGAYANAFTKMGDDAANEELSDIRGEVTPAFYARAARLWAEAGADILGGCCGISPAHIKALRDGG